MKNLPISQLHLQIVAVISIANQPPVFHVAAMQREVDWIIDALERNPAKTQTGLAEALGIDKSGVSRMLKGQRRLKFGEAQRAAEYLGVSPAVVKRAGFRESSTPYQREEPPADGLARLYASASCDRGMWQVDLLRPIEQRPHAPEFASAEIAFGFYAPDDAMSPRFHPGEVVWANPARPAILGRDALLIAKDGAPGQTQVYLGVLEAKTPTLFRVSQYGVAGVKELSAADWIAAYVYGRE